MIVRREKMDCAKCDKETEHFWNYYEEVATCIECGNQFKSPIEYGDYIKAFCRDCTKRITHILSQDKKIATCTVCGRQFSFKPRKP